MTSKRSKGYPTSPLSDLWKVKNSLVVPFKGPVFTTPDFYFTAEVQNVRPTKKMGGRKPSIVGTVRLFHRKLNIVKELKQELEYQIHSGLDPEVVSVTHDEFKRTRSQLDKLVDQLPQSQNVDAGHSLNDAACLSKPKVEVAQIVPSAPESPGVDQSMQSMRDTRQQQLVNNLADQQSTSNPINIHRQVQSAMGFCKKILIESSVLMYRIIYSHQHLNKQTPKT